MSRIYEDCRSMSPPWCKGPQLSVRVRILRTRSITPYSRAQSFHHFITRPQLHAAGSLSRVEYLDLFMREHLTGFLNQDHWKGCYHDWIHTSRCGGLTKPLRLWSRPTRKSQLVASLSGTLAVSCLRIPLDDLVQFSPQPFQEMLSAKLPRSLRHEGAGTGETMTTGPEKTI